MFSTSHPGFDEALKGQVRIEDSTVEAVRAMLAYIYTGRIDWPTYTTNSSKKKIAATMEAVLKLADKYALLDLKTHVEGRLADGLDKESFFHLALLADDHACAGLKRGCALYFVCNRHAIVEMPGWRWLKGERSALAAELLEAAAAGRN